MSKRKIALEIIRIEYATHGCSTVKAVRTYVENPISMVAYQAVAAAGIKQYEANKTEEKNER